MLTRNFVTAVVAILVVLSTQLLPMQHSGNFAFAEVQEQVATTKTLQYAVMAKSQSNDGSICIESTTFVQMLGDKRKREGIVVRSFKWLGVDQALDPATRVVIIYDRDKQQSLTLFPDKREFVRRRMAGGLSDPIGFLSPIISVDDKYAFLRDRIWNGPSDTVGLLSPIISSPAGKENDPAAAKIIWQLRTHTPHAQHDLHKLIRQVPQESAKLLPEETIDGRRAVGFVVETERAETAADAVKSDVGKYQHTWWMDCEAKLPIRLEIKYRSNYAFANAVDWTVSNIVFDEPLDESLFSTDPPGDYTQAAENAAN